MEIFIACRLSVFNCYEIITGKKWKICRIETFLSILLVNLVKDLKVKKKLHLLKTICLTIISKNYIKKYIFKLDPYYLLEFLVNCDELQASHFSLYQNIMIISLVLNGKTDIALDQIDNILATSVSRHENSFDGKIFQDTV